MIEGSVSFQAGGITFTAGAGSFVSVDAFRTVEWHILFLLGALIPLSHAVREPVGSKRLFMALPPP